MEWSTYLFALRLLFQIHLWRLFLAGLFHQISPFSSYPQQELIQINLFMSLLGGHREMKALGCTCVGIQKYWNTLCAGHSTVSVVTPTASGGCQPKICCCYKHPQEKHDFLSVDNSTSTEICICRSPSLFLWILNSYWLLVGKNEGGEVSIPLKPTVSVMGIYCNIKML